MVDGWGSPKIYDHIAQTVGDQRWSGRNVQGMFRKMERYYGPHPEDRGTSGWLYVRPGTCKAPFYKDLIASTINLTGAPFQNDTAGDGIHLGELQVSPNGRRSSSFQDLLIPKLAQGNVKILFNTLVTKVGISNGRADGVWVVHKPHAYGADNSASDGSPNQELHTVFRASKEVIISGGAIQTPQILLLSGIGPKAHLEEVGIPVILDRPGVGSGLTDHHEATISFEMKPEYVWPGQAANCIDKIDSALEQPVHPKNLPELKSFLETRADTQEQKETSGGVVIDWYSGIPSDIDHDLHIHCSEGFFYDFDFESNRPLPDGKSRGDYFPSQTDPYHPNFLKVYQNFLVENLRPSRADGTIRLASSDPTVPPSFNLSLYTDDEGCRRMANGFLICRRIAANLQKYYIREVFPGPNYQTVDQLTEYVKRWSSIGHHISGTVRMGLPNDPMAVVDSELRVIGVPNLRVVDNSIYPAPWLHGYNVSRSAYLAGEMAAMFMTE